MVRPHIASAMFALTRQALQSYIRPLDCRGDSPAGPDGFRAVVSSSQSRLSQCCAPVCISGSRPGRVALFVARVNGETATRHGYASAGGRGYVEVDCETGTMVYEGGLDSVQQALFFSHVTGKRPAVVIYDTDGREQAVWNFCGIIVK